MRRRLDLSNQVFGKLTALQDVGKNHKGTRNWECRCECGNTKVVSTSELRSGNTSSCGCIRENDLTGEVFGRLTAVKDVGEKFGTRLWECECSCGNKTNVVSTNLKKGITKSCGCLVKDRASEANTKHGMHGTPEYLTWQRMKERCFRTKNDNYSRYGGRGITVYEEWINDFKSFFDHIGSKPGPEYSIDRIDNDGNYEPGNVRWATPYEQTHNRSCSQKYSK